LTRVLVTLQLSFGSPDFTNQRQTGQTDTHGRFLSLIGRTLRLPCNFRSLSS
jgi:hypothetical protein